MNQLKPQSKKPPVRYLDSLANRDLACSELFDKSQNIPVQQLKKAVKRILTENQQSPNGSAQKIVACLSKLGLTSSSLQVIEDYCLQDFQNLALFSLYEVSTSLNLPRLKSRCQEQLCNENYEQMNYSKFDLVKLSFHVFTQLLAEHQALVHCLQIRGFSESELRTIINDYCINAGIAESERKKLQQVFITNQDLTGRVKVKRQDGKLTISAVDSTNQASPLKVKRFESLQKVPQYQFNVNSIRIKEQKEEYKEQQKAEQKKDEEDPEAVENLPDVLGFQKKTSVKVVNEVKKMIADNHERQNEVYSDIVQMTRDCTKDPSRREIKDRLKTIEDLLEGIEEEMAEQNEKLNKIKVNVGNITSKPHAAGLIPLND